MSRTILTQVNGFTPVIDHLTDELGLVTAAVFGVTWRYCQMSDGVCRASTETIAARAGISRRTVVRHLRLLVKAGYLKDLTPEVKHAPHTYQDTGKAGLEGELRAVVDATEDPEGVPESHTSESGGVTEDHTGCDRESQLGVTESHTKIQDQESLQERKDPAPSGADPVGFSAGSAVEEVKGAADRLRSKLGDDYLPVAASCAEAQEGPGAISTVPAEAGGADGLGDVLLGAWLRQKRVARATLPDKLASRWPVQLAELARGLGLDEDQAVRVVETVLDPESKQFSYYRYNDPANKKFRADFTDVALELLNGGDGQGPKEGAANKRRDGRREYEPCTDEERRAAWEKHGARLEEFMADLQDQVGPVTLAPGLYRGQIAQDLGLAEREAQALCEAWDLWFDQVEPVDVDAVLGEVV